jgi:hypothetical protein
VSGLPLKGVSWRSSVQRAPHLHAGWPGSSVSLLPSPQHQTAPHALSWAAAAHTRVRIYTESWRCGLCTIDARAMHATLFRKSTPVQSSATCSYQSTSACVCMGRKAQQCTQQECHVSQRPFSSAYALPAAAWPQPCRLHGPVPSAQHRHSTCVATRAAALAAPQKHRASNACSSSLTRATGWPAWVLRSGSPGSALGALLPGAAPEAPPGTHNP